MLEHIGCFPQKAISPKSGNVTNLLNTKKQKQKIRQNKTNPRAERCDGKWILGCKCCQDKYCKKQYYLDKIVEEFEEKLENFKEAIDFEGYLKKDLEIQQIFEIN